MEGYRKYTTTEGIFIMGSKRLAQELNISLNKIYKYCKEGMPYKKNGNDRFFDVSEVKNWIYFKNNQIKLNI